MSTLKTTNLQNADASSANIVLGQGSGGGATISGVTTTTTLQIADDIIHTGDTNTKIRFPSADTITAETGGSERLRITSTGQLQATSAADVRFTLGSSGTAGTNDSVHIRADSADLKFMAASSGNTIFEVNGTETLRITSGGDIQVDNGNVHIDDSGEFAVFEENTSLAFTNSAKLALDFSSNVARIRSSLNGSASVRPLTLNSGNTEVLRIYGTQALFGATTAYNVFENSATAPRVQVRGTDLNGSCQAWIRATADAGAPKLFMGNTRSTDEGGQTVVQNGDELGQLTFAGSDGTQFVNGCEIRGAVDGTPGADDMPGRLTFHTTNDGGTSGVERLRIDSFGRVYCNTTAQGPHGSFYTIKATDKSTNGLSVQGTTANYVYVSSAGGSTGDHIYFSNWSNSNTETGRIKDNSSNVTYHTSSDYRLKDNIVSISDGITRVKQLNPVRHTWKNNSAVGTVDGWIAHELDAVCPDAVDGVKDAVKEDGSIDPQSADYGRITPLLAAALKEAIAKIETLETKVSALESA